jgi:ketosteroid isomerase-like protein
MDAFDQAVDRYHATLSEFVKGNAEPTLEVWSQRDDVVLCNPFRPFARGPVELAETTKAAAVNFADGEATFETVEKYVTPELGYIIEVERFKATIGGTEGSGALRVTTIFRREDDGWRVSHRHADAITAPQELGSILAK